MIPTTVDVARALSSETRARLLKLLGDGPRSVTELADELGVAQPTASYHVRILRDCRLVELEADGARHLVHRVAGRVVLDLG